MDQWSSASSSIHSSGSDSHKTPTLSRIHARQVYCMYWRRSDTIPSLCSTCPLSLDGGLVCMYSKGANRRLDNSPPWDLSLVCHGQCSLRSAVPASGKSRDALWQTPRPQLDISHCIIMLTIFRGITVIYASPFPLMPSCSPQFWPQSPSVGLPGRPPLLPPPAPSSPTPSPRPTSPSPPNTVPSSTMPLRCRPS